MTVYYLNTNGFYGPSGYKKDSRNKYNVDNAKQILNNLFYDNAGEPDIIFFSEFDVYSPAGKEVFDYLGKKGYIPVYPNNETEILCKYYSIVIAFTKQKMLSKKSPTKKSLKWNEIQFGDYRIVGVHIPDSKNEKAEAELYWQSLKKHYGTYKNEKIIYIGDMNVFEEETVGKQYLNSILESARDAWIEKGNSNGGKADVTFINEKTRVDYVILSKNIPGNFNIINVQDIFRNKWSDHSALIFEF